MRSKFLTQQIVDDPVPRDVGTVGTSFVFERLEDLETILIHEDVCIDVATNRAFAFGIEHANAATVEGCSGNRFHAAIRSMPA